MVINQNFGLTDPRANPIVHYDEEGKSIGTLDTRGAVSGLPLGSFSPYTKRVLRICSLTPEITFCANGAEAAWPAGLKRAKRLDAFGWWDDRSFLITDRVMLPAGTVQRVDLRGEVIEDVLSFPRDTDPAASFQPYFLRVHN